MYIFYMRLFGITSGRLYIYTDRIRFMIRFSKYMSIRVYVYTHIFVYTYTRIFVYAYTSELIT